MTFHSANGTRDITMGDQGDILQEAEENKVPQDNEVNDVQFLMGKWIVNVDTLLQESPDTVQEIIDIADADQDVSSAPLPYIVGKFIEAMEISNQQVVSLLDDSPNLMQVTKQEWNASLNSTIAYYNDTMAQGRTICNSCSTFWNDGLSLSPAEYSACMSACIDYDPTMDNDDPDNTAGGFGDTFVGGLLDDLWTATTDNLGVILSAFLGGGNNNNPNTGGDNTSPNNNGSGEDDDEENKIDWGKIAIWGGVLIAVGLGAYFVFRKK